MRCKTMNWVEKGPGMSFLGQTHHDTWSPMRVSELGYGNKLSLFSGSECGSWDGLGQATSIPPVRHTNYHSLNILVCSVPEKGTHFADNGTLFCKKWHNFWFQKWVHFLVPEMGTSFYVSKGRTQKWVPNMSPFLEPENSDFGCRASVKYMIRSKLTNHVHKDCFYQAHMSCNTAPCLEVLQGFWNLHHTYPSLSKASTNIRKVLLSTQPAITAQPPQSCLSKRTWNGSKVYQDTMMRHRIRLQNCDRAPHTWKLASAVITSTKCLTNWHSNWHEILRRLQHNFIHTHIIHLEHVNINSMLAGQCRPCRRGALWEVFSVPSSGTEKHVFLYWAAL